jgi:NTE family protein
MSNRGNKAHQPHWKSHRTQHRPPFECIALLLQGGGSLGAYQAGVYQALSEARLDPDWVAGISIGAINSAIIAGNPAESRLENLRAFWELVTAPPPPPGVERLEAGADTSPLHDLLSLACSMTAPLWPYEVWATRVRGDVARGLMGRMSSGLALTRGASGFFAPYWPGPHFQPAGVTEATGYYDTTPLKATLERLVDFDRLNAGDIRFSVGAVNVSTGNFVYFDNATHTIRPEHIMASGALPPGFPPVEIDGEYYWDGGLVSNTPLQWVLESEPRRHTLAFQVDLWSARGTRPRNIAEVMTRQKEIQYSSRTRANSDRFKYDQKIRNALADLIPKLPDELKNSPEVEVLRSNAGRTLYNLVQLIYRSRRYEGDSKDYDFSHQSMEDHWKAGYHDTIRTLRHPEVLQHPASIEGVLSFDLARDGRE